MSAMNKILFINACVREKSRTLALAREIMKSQGGEVTEVKLEAENIRPLDGELLAKREELIARGEWDAPMFRRAREFSEADDIIIAAPFWDLGFPSLLKIYLEAVTIPGIAFKYTKGVPSGLCRAKSLKYVTTSGGRIFQDFGYSYVKALAEGFYGIEDISCYCVQNLDAECVPTEELLERLTIIK